MIAIVLRVGTALIAALLLMGAGYLAVHGQWFRAALLVLAPLALLLLSFAIEAVWLHGRNARDPAPRASPGQLLRAVVEEIRIFVPLFFWHQMWSPKGGLKHLEADRHAGRTPVLLVHGYFCNAAFWHRWTSRLRDDDHPFIAVTLEPAFGSIDRMAPVIDDALTQLAAATGRPALIVAHSMGGLAVRAWWRQATAAAARNVHHVITLGTPHQGTAIARWSHTSNGRQMRENGPWIQALRADEPPDRVRQFTCFYSHCDNIVFPASNATLPGAHNRHLMATAHVALVAHPEPWSELRRWLGSTAARLDTTVDLHEPDEPATAGRH
jgi:triacylglycerol lipase